MFLLLSLHSSLLFQEGVIIPLLKTGHNLILLIEKTREDNLRNPSILVFNPNNHFSIRT